MPDSSKAEHSKLRWYCHRGMKELDIVLGEYLENHYPNAHKTEQQAFEELLQLEDPILFSMILGNHKPNNSQQELLLKALIKLFSIEKDPKK